MKDWIKDFTVGVMFFGWLYLLLLLGGTFKW